MVGRSRILLDAFWRVFILLYSPPFKAKNMVDLVNLISKRPVRFPRDINNISEVTEDVIKRMLTVDSNKRI